MSHAIDVFAYAMPDALVVSRHSFVRTGFVSVDRRFKSGAGIDEALQRCTVGSIDDFGSDEIQSTVFDADNGRLADGASASVQPLGGVFVAFLATDIGLVNLRGPSKGP